MRNLASVSVGLSKVGEEVAYVICLWPMTPKAGHAGTTYNHKCQDLSSTQTHTHTHTHTHTPRMAQVEASRFEPGLAFSLRSKWTLLL